MKTFTCLVTLLFTCLTFQVFAQFSVGIRGGYGKAWEEYGDVDLPENAKIHINGYQASALVYLEINKIFSIGIEPGYARRGAACMPGFVDFNSDATIFLDYVELPLMISAKLLNFKNKLELYGKAGYGFSNILTGFIERRIIGSDAPPERSRINFENQFGINVSRWDNGVYGGLGVGYKIKNARAFLESDYYTAMKDTDTNNTSKNRSIHLAIGYLMDLK